MNTQLSGSTVEVAAVVAAAAEVMGSRWDLTSRAALAALIDIAAETGVDVGDLAALVVAADRNAVPGAGGLPAGGPPAHPQP